MEPSAGRPLGKWSRELIAGRFAPGVAHQCRQTQVEPCREASFNNRPEQLGRRSCYETANRVLPRGIASGSWQLSNTRERPMPALGKSVWRATSQTFKGPGLRKETGPFVCTKYIGTEASKFNVYSWLVIYGH